MDTSGTPSEGVGGGDSLDGLQAKVKFQDSYAAFVDDEKVPAKNIISLGMEGGEGLKILYGLKSMVYLVIR